MGGRFVFEFLIGAGLLWLFTAFHWTRILACLALLAVWGLATVIAPIYFAVMYLSQGAIFSAILTVAIASILGLLWWVVAKAAYDWAKWHERFGKLWLPWNAR